MKIRLLILFLLFSSSRVFGQCTLVVNISSSETAICSGSTVILTANTSGGTGPFTYVWSTGETTQTIPVNKAGKYTVTITDKTPGCSPVQASKDMTVSPVPDAPVAKGKVVCPNSRADLIATGPGGAYEWYDADGNFLKAGAAYTTLPVTGPTIYYVQTTVGGCTSLRTAVVVNITGRPTTTPATICAGSRATLIASGGDSYAWFDTPTSTTVITTSDRLTTPILTSTRSYYVEAVINGCTSPRTKVTATVGEPPAPPVVVNPGGVCSGSVVMLHADVPDGIVDWYPTPTGGTSLISSPDYTTQPLTANTTFYVQTTLNDCQSNRVPVNIIVNPIPSAPAPQTVPACYNSRVNLTASANPAGSYKWFDAPTGGHQVSADNVFFTPPLIRNTTYYVSVTKADCGSPRTAINVIVSAPITAPSVSPATICNGSIAVLTPMSPAGSYAWFDVPADGTPIFNGTSFTTPPLTASRIYYVQNTVSGCTSARTSVNVTVLPIITAPTAPGTTVCSGSSAILTATGSSGSYEWYDVPTGGTVLSDSRVFETDVLTATKTYYVLATQNDCQSERKAVIVTVNATPPMPTAPDGPTICPGLIAHLTASPSSGGNITWYGSAAGSDLLSSTNNYDTPHLFATTTFYVQNNVGDCSSPRKAVTVTVNTGGTTFQYSSGTYSKTAGNPMPIVVNPSGGTFSASPAGLVFVNNNTGQIDVGASAVGTYTVTLTSPGTCSGTYTTTVTITNNPLTGFTYGGPFCQGGNNPFPIFNNGASAGVFTAPSGLVFVNTTTGQINLNASTAGTYIVTNTIPASGAAPAVSSSASVTIRKKVTIDAGPDQRKQIGSPVNLAGTVSSGSVTWSGGGGNFSNPNSKNTVYTPAVGETHVTLTLTSNSAAAPCSISSDNVDIYFFDTPPAPDAQDASICLGSNTTLSATAPGGIYRWYDKATNGTLLETGPTFKIIGLTVTTTYYVQTTLNGVTGPRKAVTVTVNSTSAAPTALGQTVCSGSSTTLTATGATGGYEWYDVPVGGQRLSIEAGFLTPPVYTQTTYYVQSVLGNCRSARTPVIVKVTPVPTITSGFGDAVCSGTALNYTITADLPITTTFSWDRAAVPGISNPPVVGSTASIIGETLINTSGTPIDVSYLITPTTGDCSGTPFEYRVTVNPTPTVAGPNSVPPICNGTSSNYQITFNTGSATSFTWGHDAVAGISNGAVSGQGANVIREVLFNTSNAPVDVIYTIKSKTSTCPGDPFNLKVTVNPAVNIISDPSNTTCSGTALPYTIKSNVPEPNVTFKWERAAVNNISNPATTGNTSTIDEPLINTGTGTVNVIYIITPTAYGCEGNPFAYVVGVSPQPVMPVANSNSPICVGNAIELATPPVPRATYEWTGPDGFTSTEQNPKIPNATLAKTGTYNLYVKVGDCTSLAGSVEVIVNALPHVDAGEPGKFCVTTTSIPLDGKITGSTTTGVWSSTGSPNTLELGPSVLVNIYHPSVQDIAAGRVTLILTSTSPDGCADTAHRVITFGTSPGADAGADISVCAQDTRVLLSGKILIPNGTGVWTSPTQGTFANQTDNQTPIYYIPNAQDVANGSVTLTLHANNSGQCFDPTDDVVIKLIPPPTVDAGGIRYVLKDHTITLNPTVSDENVTYNWSPNINISSTTVKNPVITGDIDRTYTLTVTDVRGCISPVSQTFIRVSPIIDVPNTFTPNGDGFNDKWEIAGLVAYENCTVDIFNRYGAKLFHSKGYPTPWDGRYNGGGVPPGVYYYIIDTKMNGKVITGNVTIIR